MLDVYNERFIELDWQLEMWEIQEEEYWEARRALETDNN
jgi:hypothetical protein